MEEMQSHMMGEDCPNNPGETRQDGLSQGVAVEPEREDTTVTQRRSAGKESE